MKKIVLFSFCSLIVLLNSCEEKIRTPLNIPIDTTIGPMKAKFSAIQSTVLNNKCATSGCHINGGTFPNLTDGVSYASLFKVQSTYNSLLIQPGNAMGSVLYMKIIANPNFGGIMPSKSSGFSALPQAQIDSIKAWIDNGAINN